MMKNFILLAISILGLTTNLWSQERGIASYYSDSFDGRATASGEKYNKNLLTGAHKTLPFGTIVKVTRIDNGKSVEIRINDLGPYISGRIIDISGKAAEVLGLKASGTAEVTLQVIGKSDVSPRPSKTTSSALPPTPTLETKRKEKKKATPTEYVAKEQPKPAPKKEKEFTAKEFNIENPKPAPKKEKVEKAKPKRQESTASATTHSEAIAYESAPNFKAGRSYKIEIKSTEEKLFGVQVAAVKDIDGMMNLVTKYQGKWFDDVFVNVEEQNGQPIYKIVLGAFRDKKKASNYKKSLKKRKKIDGFVVPIR